MTIFFFKKWKFLAFFLDVKFLAIFWQSNGNLPEGQIIAIYSNWLNAIYSRYRDHYKWNKVTTCVHNLLGGQRWADQYGEMTITNNNIVCKLTFTKVSDFWYIWYFFLSVTRVWKWYLISNGLHLNILSWLICRSSFISFT